MYMVYWTEIEDQIVAARGLAFDTREMGAALQFMEQLRARQRAGQAVSFITMSSEHPDSVGPPGVGEPASDYSWKKRRP